MKKTLTIVAFAAMLASCNNAVSNSFKTEQLTTEQNQLKLINALPPPILNTSAERKNLIKRLNRLNSENMTGCVYLISMGRIISHYVIAGKVSSLNAYLSGDTKIVRDPYGSLDAGGQTVESPDFDGTYGKNPDGIFFFTADTDTYVEWKGDFLFTDQCLKIDDKPLLTKQVTEE